MMFRSSLLRHSGNCSAVVARPATLASISGKRSGPSSLVHPVAWKSTAAAADIADSPALNIIPTLPIVGSFMAGYSKTPAYEKSTVLEFWPEMQRRFGDFYRMGMPGLGAGLHGHLHILQDPKEMVKLLRRESGKTFFGSIFATDCLMQEFMPTILALTTSITQPFIFFLQNSHLVLLNLYGLPKYRPNDIPILPLP